MLKNGRYYSLLHALGSSIHPARRARDRMFVVIQVSKLYADVSGSTDSRFVVAAAYVASESAWKRFEKAWGAILNDLKGVSVFHATDFFAWRNEFKPWKDDKEWQKRFAIRFTGAATRHTAFGVSFALERAAYDDLMARPLKGLHRPDARVSAEAFCIVNCLAHVDRVVKREKWSLDIAAILESGGGSGDAVALLNKLQGLGEPWAKRYVSFTTMSKCERPLQATDLLAHENWRHITRLKNPPDGRSIRAAMKALLVNGNIVSVYAEREDIESSLPEVLRAVGIYKGRSKR
jgi:hypothetical protein